MAPTLHDALFVRDACHQFDFHQSTATLPASAREIGFSCWSIARLTIIMTLGRRIWQINSVGNFLKGKR
jgi:hypothetical protein